MDVEYSINHKYNELPNIGLLVFKDKIMISARMATSTKRIIKHLFKFDIEKANITE